MAMQADASGACQGTFDIPVGVPAGVKTVLFEGDGGSRAEAQYEGVHILETQVMRERHIRLWGDPLAQTFVPEKTMICGGIDLYVDTKGTSDIEVQVRTVDNGVPTKVVATSGRLSPDEITVDQYNRWSWAPIRLPEGAEMCVVILCDDADSEVGIAKLGAWDATAGRWITAQPYSVGVLLSSSNASTWTPHQDVDLAFKLLDATFTTLDYTVDLGTVTLAAATDIMVDAPVDTLAPGTAVTFQLTMPSAAIYTVSPNQPLSLADAETGDMTVRARLTGTAEGSPVLLPGVQVFHGATHASGTYVTRTMPAANPSDITVRIDAQIPGTSAVVVHCQPSSEDPDSGTWTEVPFDSATDLGSGVQERAHVLSGYTNTDVRLRLTLSGDAVNRPKVSNLRAVVT